MAEGEARRRPEQPEDDEHAAAPAGLGAHDLASPDAASADGPGAGGPGGPGGPGGEVYDWYVRGLSLLKGGNPQAAAQLLQHAEAQVPDSASVREALARALFDAGRYGEASTAFRDLTARNPSDDYAQFGLGLSLSRLGQFGLAVEHLAMAVAMRPQRVEYVRALQAARATLRARRASG